MLLSLGKLEADQILEDEGEISINCEFSNSSNWFDQIASEQVFGAGGIAAPSAITHK